MRPATDNEFLTGINGFIDNCIAAERRARFIGFSHSVKGFKKWLEQLDHFQKHLDISFATSVASSETTADLISKFKLPAQSDVLVVSTLDGMQRAVLCLQDALEETYKMGNGSLICALGVQPSFWFYLGEEAHAQYLFLKANP